jgi:hypothetical protein
MFIILTMGYLLLSVALIFFNFSIIKKNGLSMVFFYIGIIFSLFIPAGLFYVAFLMYYASTHKKVPE